MIVEILFFLDHHHITSSGKVIRLKYININTNHPTLSYEIHHIISDWKYYHLWCKTCNHTFLQLKYVNFLEYKNSDKALKSSKIRNYEFSFLWNTVYSRVRPIWSYQDWYPYTFGFISNRYRYYLRYRLISPYPLPIPISTIAISMPILTSKYTSNQYLLFVSVIPI